MGRGGCRAPHALAGAAVRFAARQAISLTRCASPDLGVLQERNPLGGSASLDALYPSPPERTPVPPGADESPSVSLALFKMGATGIRSA